MRAVCVGLLGGMALAACGKAQTFGVMPSVETVPVPTSGDAADDPAVWIHPDNPALSLVIGTDKHSGLAAYNLDGSQVQFLSDGDINNVDLRYNVVVGGVRRDIVAATERVANTIVTYKVDPLTRTLMSAGPPIPTGFGCYGFCMYHSPYTGLFYAVANDENGNVKQWKLSVNAQGQIAGQLVRSFAVGSITEGMVADDELGWLYISEENVGIWRYGAEPGAGTGRTLVDSTGAPGHLTADVEGLSIYYAAGGAGYLLASSQGSSTFVIYERQGANAYVTTFQVVAGNGIDGVSGTDGIDVTNVNLGTLFPLGAFVTQDDSNPGANQNFKLVRWEAIALSAPKVLIVDTTSWDPRAIRGDLNHDGTVGVPDFLLLLSAWGACAQCPPQGCPADLDHDCTVDVPDFLALLANWG